MKITENLRRIPVVAVFVAIILYMELLLRALTCPVFFDSGLVFMPLYSLLGGGLLAGLCTLFPVRARRVAEGVTVALLFVLYATQAVYFRFFSKFLIVYSLTSGGVTQVLSGDMAWNVWYTILNSFLILLALALPLVLYFVFEKRLCRPAKPLRRRALCFAVVLALQAVLPLAITWMPQVAMAQTGLFDPNDAVGEFGLLRTEVLDVYYNLLGAEQKLDLETEVPVSAVPLDGANVANIDFAALADLETDETLRAMHTYFANKQPTEKNAYTGMYAGYNLVYVVAEGFSPYAIDPVLTPTLYKMREEGFDFQNFYTPIWGVSTSDGEYTACTGLIPKAGVWSFYESHDNYMPYTLGNMFRKHGVRNVAAYHNNSHAYYHRDLSHPNMGYAYQGMGSGVEAYVQNLWPQSDLEMVAGSIPDYLTADAPFHAYYMTVSGHLDYDPDLNAMSEKNWALVKDLDCSDTLKAYYACNIELDRAMEHLLTKLREAGVAEKTVIAITPDHYPYGLEQESGGKYDLWEELLGHPVDTAFELYESCFLLYCAGTENPPAVDKVCYSADILPTLLNLFGFEYDSRLLIGQDMLSSAEGLVIFDNGSFITDDGRYDANADEFTVTTDALASEEEAAAYCADVKARVNNSFKIAAKILEEDYYRHIFKAR